MTARRVTSKQLFNFVRKLFHTFCNDINKRGLNFPNYKSNVLKIVHAKTFSHNEYSGISFDIEKFT